MNPISTNTLLQNQMLSWGLTEIPSKLIAAYDEERFVDVDASARDSDARSLSTLPAGSKINSFTTAAWIAKIQTLLAHLKFQPAELMKLLCEHPTIKNCFSKDAAVSEGYTVGQHTEMVLGIAQQFRENFFAKVNPIISWDKFILFLCLHDIGKGIAKEKQPEAFSSPLSFKEAELGTTREMLENIMSQFGIAERDIILFKAMLEFDTLGLFLREHIGVDEAFDNILEMARACSLEPLQFFQLFEVFHMIDAASYPGLRDTIFTVHNNTLKHSSENQIRVDAINKRLQAAKEGHQAFECLVKLVAGENVQTVTEYFFTHLTDLSFFLVQLHKEMLTSPQNKMLKEVCRRVKKGFRDLFLLLIKNRTKNEVLTSYEGMSTHSLGMAQKNVTNLSYDFAFFLANSYSQFSNKYIELKMFTDELMNFRKNYLCRYSVHKVIQAIHEQVEVVKKWSADEAEGQSEILKVVKEGRFTVTPGAIALLKTTFLHGTNSAICVNLLKTGLQLISSGRLLRSGIVPLSGELSEGAGIDGLNRYLISGTSLNQAPVARKYAINTDFHASQKDEENRIVKFLQIQEKEIKERHGELFEDTSDTTSWSWLTRMSIGILRMRILNPNEFKAYEPRLRAIVDAMESSFKRFTSSDTYKRNMPSDLDKDGKLGYSYRPYDYYWYRHFNRTETEIANIKSSLDKPLNIPKGVQEATEKTYPIVFGSHSLHTQTIDLSNPYEQASIKASKLGKDLQMVFVPSEDVVKANNFLKAQGLLDRVKVFAFDDMMNAWCLNALASPYFADFASRKKLAKGINK